MMAAGDYEFRNRVYSPSLGRWFSNDPLGFEAGDQNWYRAIGNNPGNGNDPSGLDAGIGGLVVDEMPEIPRNPYGIWVPKNPEDTFWELIKGDVWDTGSQIVGMIPVVGDYKDIQEIITGYDLITGEFLTPGQRLLTAGAAMIPGLGAATVRKLAKNLDPVGNLIGKNVDDLPSPSSAWRQDIPSDNVNLVNPQRTIHILDGDATGGGHLFPGKPGKTSFPENWTGEKIMHEVSDVATDPALEWVQQTGKAGSLYTKAGDPARFYVVGERAGVKIKVVIEPAGEGIITAHPIR